jgi:hypothetical protein
MASTGIALDDVAEIDDFSDRTLLEVADRLERSTTFQECIARDLEDGQPPCAPYHAEVYRRRAWSAVLPHNDDFLNDPVATAMHTSLVP